MPAGNYTKTAELSQEQFVEAVMQRAREVARAVFESAMEAELDAFVNAMPYERAEARRGHRNGFYQRDLVTGMGVIRSLQVPRSREGGFQTKLLSRYRRRQEAVDRAIAEIFVRGVSTTRTQCVTELVWGDRPSASTVSRIFHSLQEECDGWRSRPLEPRYRYIHLDGVYFTVGYDGEYVKEPMLAALGVKDDGERELLGYGPGNKESYEAWKAFLQELRERGLQGADLFVTDGSQALIKALEDLFLQPKRQRCVVHKLRNVLAKVPRRQQKGVSSELKRIFYQENKEAAYQEAEAFFAKWEPVIPEAVRCLEKDLEECLSFYDFPREHWKYIRSNNCLERVFSEVKRRTKLMGAFRNEKSCTLVFFAVIRALRFRRIPTPEILHRT